MKKMVAHNRILQILRLALELDDFSIETRVLAASITLAEMRFRPLTYRIFEYFYVVILLSLGRDVGRVSVGISQISIRHIERYEEVNQFNALRLALSARNNLRVCCLILEEKSVKSIKDVARLYNGRSTLFYKRTLEFYHSSLLALASGRPA